MDTNLFIKSYKTDGNKVTDIQFYGDWELEIGGEKTQYIDVNAMSHGIAPTGIDYLDTSTATSFKFKNNTGRTVYFRVVYSWAYVGQSVASTVTVANGNTISYSLTSTDERAMPQVGIFSDNLCKNMIGYITFRRGDVPVEITHY